MRPFDSTHYRNVQVEQTGRIVDMDTGEVLIAPGYRITSVAGAEGLVTQVHPDGAFSVLFDVDLPMDTYTCKLSDIIAKESSRTDRLLLFDLVDQDNPKHIIRVRMTTAASCLSFQFEGYGTFDMKGGPPLSIEIRNGTPNIQIWPDINLDEEMCVSLEDAHEDCYLPTTLEAIANQGVMD